MKAIITVGISGSGKSTWAEKHKMFQYCDEGSSNLKIINRDETRWEISGKRGWNGPQAYRFNKKIEAHVTARNNDKMVYSALKGFDIIIADTNLNPKFRNDLIEACKFLGYEVEIKEFPISFQEACKRDAQRGIFSVGETVLMKQWEQWVAYHAAKGEGMWG